MRTNRSLTVRVEIQLKPFLQSIQLLFNWLDWLELFLCVVFLYGDKLRFVMFFFVYLMEFAWFHRLRLNLCEIRLKPETGGWILAMNPIYLVRSMLSHYLHFIQCIFSSEISFRSIILIHWSNVVNTEHLSVWCFKIFHINLWRSRTISFDKSWKIIFMTEMV